MQRRREELVLVRKVPKSAYRRLFLLYRGRERGRLPVVQRLEHGRQLQPVRGRSGHREYRQCPEPDKRRPERLRGRRLQLRGLRLLDQREPEQLHLVRPRGKSGRHRLLRAVTKERFWCPSLC